MKNTFDKTAYMELCSQYYERLQKATRQASYYQAEADFVKATKELTRQMFQQMLNEKELTGQKKT